MRRALFATVVVLALVSLSSGKNWKPMAGAGVGFGLAGDEAGFQMSIEGLAPIYQNIFVKASLIRLWVGDYTQFGLGPATASYGMPAVYILYFIPGGGNVEPYASAGMQFGTISSGGSSSTVLSFIVGGGAQYELPNSPIRLFGEMGFGIINTSSSYSYGGYFDGYFDSASNTDFLFTTMFGVRFGG